MNKMFVVDKEKARLFIKYLNYHNIKYDCADYDNKVRFLVCMSDEEYDDYEENYIGAVDRTEISESDATGGEPKPEG